MTPQPDSSSQAFAIRMWMACLATQELLSIYLGVRLGLYEHLAAGPATAGGFAERAGLAPRYAREWLEQQAVAGILTVDGSALPADERVYTLPAAHRRVLTVSDDPMSMAALAVLPLGGVAGALPSLLEAFRSGEGVPDRTYGDDWRHGHAGANRALYAHQLAGWLRRHLPDVHARLAAGTARIADVACGAGWSTVALARTYPGARVDGIDLDEAVLAEARGNAEAAGLAGRVAFARRDAAEAPRGERYDLVCLFDALHEMARPVDVLRACRAMRAGGGCVLVMDARVAETFTAPGDEIERFQYATSVLHCLPASLVEESSAGTGTVMRPDTVRAYARAAGFAAVEVIDAADRFHRLYRLEG